MTDPIPLRSGAEEAGTGCRTRRPPRRGYDPADALVGREATALSLLGLGVTPDGIARHLGLRPASLERLLFALRERLGVLGNAELADLARRRRDAGHAARRPGDDF